MERTVTTGGSRDTEHHYFPDNSPVSKEEAAKRFRRMSASSVDQGVARTADEVAFT